jgi:hypothetical protein
MDGLANVKAVSKSSFKKASNWALIVACTSSFGPAKAAALMQTEKMKATKIRMACPHHFPST